MSIDILSDFYIKYVEMNFHNLEIKKPNGDLLKMKDFNGKLLLIVNTATKCGLSPQFKGLELIHQTHKDKGLVIIGTPCSQFMNQEPETNLSVEMACEINFGVTFQLTEKIDVNGENQHPIYRYLKNKKGGLFSRKIKWNFTKFLISQDGKVLKRYSPITTPKRIEIDILKHLKK